VIRSPGGNSNPAKAGVVRSCKTAAAAAPTMVAKRAHLFRPWMLLIAFLL
jgi:hypothetical protein